MLLDISVRMVRGMSEQSLPRPPTLREAVAAEIRAHMGRRNIKPARLAEALGRNPMWLSRRLNGHVPWTVDDLEVISNEFNMDIIELLAGIRTDPNEAAVDRRALVRRRFTCSPADGIEKRLAGRHLQSVPPLAA